MIHMLRERAGLIVTTRCRTEIKLKSGQSIGDAGITNREHRVTCFGCQLKGPA